MSRKGKALSEEHKANIKASYNEDLREVHRQIMLKKYADPKERILQSKRMKLAMSRAETKIRLSEGQKKRKHDETQWARMHEVRRGFKVTEETREKLSLVNKGNQYHLGHRNTPEAIEKMRNAKLGKRPSMETRLKMSKTGKRLWRQPSHKNKLVSASLKAMSIHPNKPETIVLGLLNELFPNDWEFVGDGKVVIEGKIPDFINTNGQKKIVEVFGTYWHGERARCYEETEEGRIALFKKYGYSTLIIWENELKDRDKVVDKIKEFAGVS
ncbi:hypothetical protein LCGC14_0341410 [marine sediment metagenome]|uniref:Nuclease associated modular domain-containing protein n=1 Tax=marine sediment metagenome TaxID=412755 RepID=A0A0F9TJD0_9ZZZZ